MGFLTLYPTSEVAALPQAEQDGSVPPQGRADLAQFIYGREQVDEIQTDRQTNIRRDQSRR